MADSPVSSPSSNSTPTFGTDHSRRDLRVRGQQGATRVVIIGGGYAGAKAALKIAKELPTYELVLIDSKDYFENTIAVLGTLTHVDIASSIEAALKIVIRHDHYLGANARFVKEMVKEVTPTKVVLENETIYYDYLILACGTSYRSSIKTPNLASEFRIQDLSKVASEVAAAPEILVVGGGLVGVELAGELIVKYPNKKITLATATDRLLVRMKPAVSNAAYKFLTSHGVNVLFNERVVQSDKDPSVFLFPTSKTEIKPAKAFWCTGFTPNNALLQKHFAGSIAENGYAKVNSFLQLHGTENIFVIGDLTDLKEEKMAERAFVHAAYVTKCLKVLRKGQPLTKGYKSPKKTPFLVISLGPDHSLLCINRKLTSQGSVAAATKRWTFRQVMVHSKNSTVVSKVLKPSESRLLLNSAALTLATDTKQVGIIGHVGTLATSIASILAQTGVVVQLLHSQNADRSAADSLAQHSALIKSHAVDSKIPNTVISPLKGVSTVIFPYNDTGAYPMILLAPFLEGLRSLHNDGSLKNIILVHPGYFVERAPKKSAFKDAYLQLELDVAAISPKLNVVCVRYAPTFDLLTLLSTSFKKDGVLKFPLPESGIHFIAMEDVRDCVLKIFTTVNDHKGQTYSVAGDNAVTPEDVAVTMNQVLGRSDVKFESVEASALLPELVKRTNAKIAPQLVEWFSAKKHLTKTSEDAATLLGMPTISWEDWLHLNTHTVM